MTGWTNSFGAGGEDLWLVKTDSAGNMIWNRTYGGQFNDEAHGLIQTSDSGYVIAGDTTFKSGNEDALLVKTDSTGNMQWNQTYGGSELDTTLSIVQLNDGSYVLGGYTSSFGAGLNDGWLIKADFSGIMQWNKTYGGPYDDYFYSMVHTNDGGFALAGETRVSHDGPSNFWLIKADSKGNVELNKINDGSTDNFAYSLIQTKDGGFALAGVMNTEGTSEDALLVKLNSTSGTAELPILPIIMLTMVILVIVLLVILYITRKRKVSLKTERTP
jgi:predicted secreted protein